MPKKFKEEESIRISGETGSGGSDPGLLNIKKTYAAAEREVHESSLHDVIIIGAGLAGLNTAYTLLKAGIENFKILDCLKRPGGKTLNQEIEGYYPAEAGAQYIGITQTAILKLLEELELPYYPSHTEGETIGASILSGAALSEYNNALLRLDYMAAQIPIAAPWLAMQAITWDSTSIGQWMNTNLKSYEAYLQLSAEIEGFLGPVDDISLLFFLSYTQSAGGLKALIHDAQALRIVGGAYSISHRLADRLKDHIVYEAEVTAIYDRGESVDVEYNKTESFSARKVVVAMMPKVAAKITYAPVLPENKRQLLANWPASQSSKISIAYDSPFWREEGLSGKAYSLTGPLSYVFDNSPQDASCGILSAVPSKQFWKIPAVKREAAAVEALVNIFGKAAKKKKAYREMNWEEYPSLGGFASPLPPGFLTNFGKSLRPAVGNIHWAGSETSEIWNGYMEGAVRSGIRAAEEVLAQLCDKNPFGKMELEVFPSQSIGHIHLRIRKTAIEMAIIQIFNMQGQVIVMQQIPNINDFTTIDINHLQDGMYIARLKSGKRIWSAEFVLEKGTF